MEGSHIVSAKDKFIKNFWGIRPFKRHGLVLMIAGCSYMLLGIAYLFAKTSENSKVALQIALSWFPIEFWGSAFTIVGMLVIVSSRWPPVAERWGYMLLTGFSAGWAATYATGVIFGDSPASNLAIALIWGLLAFLWWAVSGFVNPDKTIVVVITNDDGAGASANS